jgi:hypothetical protein
MARPIKNKITDGRIQKRIAKEYAAGMSIRKLRKQYNIGEHEIRRYCDQYDIKYRPIGPQRKYIINEHYFDLIDTPNKAYVLGMWYADGCNKQKNGSININLIKEDAIQILTDIREEMGANVPLKQYRNTKQLSLSFYSNHMCQQLTNLGCVPAKSLILTYPNSTIIPDHLQRSFIRGYLDGDGSIYKTIGNKIKSVTGTNTKHYKSWTVKFTSSTAFIVELHNVLQRIVGLSRPYNYNICGKSKKTANLSITRKKDVVKLLDWMYDASEIKNGGLYMHRKHNKYIQAKKDLTYSYLTFNQNGTLNEIKKSYIRNLGKREKANLIKELSEFFSLQKFQAELYSEDDVKRQIEFLNAHDLNVYMKATKNTNRLRISPNNYDFLWDYFPNALEVSCVNRPPISKTMDNSHEMRMVITELLNDDNYLFNITVSTMRSKLKKKWKQAVSNFRPITAAALYKLFAGTDATVWDMSAGWGGRMLGACLAGNVKKYIGTEPSTKTFEGLTKLKNDLNTTYGFADISIELHQLGSEVFNPAKESLDMCFTSPPYFDTEKYSNEDTQSYVKYPTPAEWVNGFLKQTIQNCYDGLKHDKFMLINIKNIKAIKDLVEITKDLCESIGFAYEDEYFYMLPNRRYDKSNKEIYEPVLIFKKP